MVKFFVVVVLMCLAYIGFSKFMDTSLLVGEKIKKLLALLKKLRLLNEI